MRQETPYYLRLEGVNLTPFVLDTSDLSTTRGASLLLLEAVTTAQKALEQAGLKPETLSLGASSGLFGLQTAESAKAVQVVREALGPGTRFQDATFMVDILPAADLDPASSTAHPFRQDLEKLIAANRWQQMQAATLSIPKLANSDPVAPCGMDGLRPAGSHKAKGVQVSETTLRRREVGRQAKTAFYEELFKPLGIVPPSIPKEWTFARDFGHIAKVGASGKGDLDGKLAVFYADGNNFGKQQQEHCTSPNRQKAFDEEIRHKRALFLKAFLEKEVIGKHEEWTRTTPASEPQASSSQGTDASVKTELEYPDDITHIIRFETLLWGGDELIFVMPARLGWRFAIRFFQTLRLSIKTEHNQEIPLTHAAALVFCQGHAPIGRIQSLARGQMAEFGKHATQRACDSLTVVALESFDHLGSSFESAMGRRYNGVVPLEEMTFKGIPVSPGSLAAKLQSFAKGVEYLQACEDFPRSQLRALVNGMVKAPKGAEALAALDPNRLPACFRTLQDDGPEAQQIRDTLRPLFRSPRALWLQLEELWDYARS